MADSIIINATGTSSQGDVSLQFEQHENSGLNEIIIGADTTSEHHLFKIYENGSALSSHERATSQGEINEVTLELMRAHDLYRDVYDHAVNVSGGVGSTAAIQLTDDQLEELATRAVTLTAVPDGAGYRRENTQTDAQGNQLWQASIHQGFYSSYDPESRHGFVIYKHEQDGEGVWIDEETPSTTFIGGDTTLKIFTNSPELLTAIEAFTSQEATEESYNAIRALAEARRQELVGNLMQYGFEARAGGMLDGEYALLTMQRDEITMSIGEGASNRKITTDDPAIVAQAIAGLTNDGVIAVEEFKDLRLKLGGLTLTPNSQLTMGQGGFTVTDASGATPSSFMSLSQEYYPQDPTNDYAIINLTTDSKNRYRFEVAADGTMLWTYVSQNLQVQEFGDFGSTTVPFNRGNDYINSSQKILGATQTARQILDSISMATGGDGIAANRLISLTPEQIAALEPLVRAPFAVPEDATSVVRESTKSYADSTDNRGITFTHDFLTGHRTTYINDLNADSSRRVSINEERNEVTFENGETSIRFYRDASALSDSVENLSLHDMTDEAFAQWMTGLQGTQQELLQALTESNFTAIAEGNLNGHRTVLQIEPDAVRITINATTGEREMISADAGVITAALAAIRDDGNVSLEELGNIQAKAEATPSTIYLGQRYL